MSCEKMLDKISELVLVSINKYRSEAELRGFRWAYDNAYMIHRVEEISYALTEEIEQTIGEESELILIALQICKNGDFIEQIVQWSEGLDNVNVSSLEATMQLIEDYLKWYKSQEK